MSAFAPNNSKSLPTLPPSSHPSGMQLATLPGLSSKEKRPAPPSSDIDSNEPNKKQKLQDSESTSTSSPNSGFEEIGKEDYIDRFLNFGEDALTPFRFFQKKQKCTGPCCIPQSYSTRSGVNLHGRYVMESYARVDFESCTCPRVIRYGAKRVDELYGRPPIHYHKYSAVEHERELIKS
jgi:hypothetical protein